MDENNYFYVDENGDLVYSGDSDSSSSSSSSSEDTTVEIYSDSLEAAASAILEESDSDVSIDDDDDVDVSENDLVESDSLSEEEITEILDSISDYSSYTDSLSTESMSYDDLVSAVADGVLTAEGASGTLSSSTLDVFDRIVSGLSSNYGYIAYRIDSSDSTSGVLIYSTDYTVDGTDVYIDGISVSVYRVSSSSSSQYITYIDYDSGYFFNGDLTDDSSIIYYTNLVSGYPVLGGYDSVNTFNYASYIVVALVAVFADVVLTKLFNRHRN